MHISSTNFALLLVFIAIFGTVAPVVVFAEDTVYISNSVYSESTTGGYSSAGEPGEAGQHGADGSSGANGADGRDGASGADGQVITSTSSASVQSTTIVDGEVVDQSTGTTTNDTDASSSVQTTYAPSDEVKRGKLIELLDALKSLLAIYVSLLL